LEAWPKACTGNRISVGASVVGLERLLDEGEQGAISSITKWIGRVLDAFEAD
jgi:hypothetical protein